MLKEAQCDSIFLPCITYIVEKIESDSGYLFSIDTTHGSNDLIIRYGTKNSQIVNLKQKISKWCENFKDPENRVFQATFKDSTNTFEGKYNISIINNTIVTCYIRIQMFKGSYKCVITNFSITQGTDWQLGPLEIYKADKWDSPKLKYPLSRINERIRSFLLELEKIK